MSVQESLEGRFAGAVRVFSVYPDECRALRAFQYRAKDNLVLYAGADILAQCVIGNTAYKVDAMYIEFQNTVGVPTPPAYDRSKSQGRPYYDGLSGSADTDFLRVSLTADPTIDDSDAVKYDGNRVTFFAMTQGSVGHHGKTFSQAANSKVYGAALVATPDWSDQSQDRVFSRVYFTEIAKDANQQVGIQWVIYFT